MPRQRATPARSAPPRPSAGPARQNPTPPQAPRRPASSVAQPPAGQQAPQQAPAQGSQGPGLFGQMASTAAGVAVGSSIGHAVGGFFGGGSSSQPAEAQSTDTSALSQATNGQYTENNTYRGCEDSAKAFTRCLDDNSGPHQMSICQFYLDQLKACQSAASSY